MVVGEAKRTINWRVQIGVRKVKGCRHVFSILKVPLFDLSINSKIFLNKVGNPATPSRNYHD